MSYLVYATEHDAAVDESRIVSNIASAVWSMFPARYDNGQLLSVDSRGNVQPDAARSTRWDIPRQCAEGWAITEPTQDMIGRVPLDAAMDGVSGVRYESVTWPVTEMP